MPQKSIAVLPFLNLSGNPLNDHICDGISEEIISTLSRLKTLRVTSRTSCFHYKNKQVVLKQVADELGVEFILEGSVKIDQDSIRIAAQLVQAREDFQFWSESWDYPVHHLFQAQDELSESIAEKIREDFGHFEIDQEPVANAKNNLQAYDYFLQGRTCFYKWNFEDVQKSISLLEKSISIDPNHSESHIALADGHAFMAISGFGNKEASWSKVVAHTQRARELNPKNPGVYYQLARLALYTDCNFQNALKYVSKSLELKPSYTEAQRFMSFLFMISGKLDRANEHLQYALAMDPLNHETLFYKGYYHYRVGMVDSAIKIFDKCLQHNSKSILSIVLKCYCLLISKEYEQVITIVNNSGCDVLIEEERIGILALAHLLNGNDQAFQELLARLENSTEKDKVFHVDSYLFLIYANMQEPEKAFHCFEKALESKTPFLLLSFTDPLVGSLKSEPQHQYFHGLLYPEPPATSTVPNRQTDPMNKQTAELFAKKLLNYVEQTKPYLDANLTLKTLADQCDLHPNHLSWLLNTQLEKNFNEFINDYRMQHFKVISLDPENAHVSLVGLAYASGFNSKSVFNTFFKKQEGITPSEYLRSSTQKAS